MTQVRGVVAYPGPRTLHRRGAPALVADAQEETTRSGIVHFTLFDAAGHAAVRAASFRAQNGPAALRISLVPPTRPATGRTRPCS